MLRRSLAAALVVVALASVAQDVHASGHSRRGGCFSYFFGGYGPGTFGYGDVSYAGYSPYVNRTCCGCRIR
jgi:hypothetical protein